MTLAEFMNIELSMGYLVVVCLIYTAILIFLAIRYGNKINKLKDEFILELNEIREANEYRW